MCLESEHLVLATAQAGAQAKGRMSLFTALGVTALAVIALLIGLAWRPALAVAAMLWFGCAAAWVLFFRTQGIAASSAASLAALNAHLREVEVEHGATVRASGDPAELIQRERQLQDTGLAIPQ